MTESNNKRIAKNTLMLYIRMFITMAVGLYTGRIVLSVLGESDYGLNNVVAGFVTMMAYLNTVFVGTGQRFLSMGLGRKNDDEITQIFSTLVIIHSILALIILIFAETFGLWFVNNGLVIDPARINAANWVYQCAIYSLILNILCVPYNSSIITHEHMQVYAYLSILQVTFNLLSVFAIQYFNVDSLKLYSILSCITTTVVSAICFVYCKRKFSDCIFRVTFDKQLVKNMLSFVGWTSLGSLGFTFKDQCINLIINHFCGTVVNAARGVAMNVNGIVNQFSQNFVMAVTPPITKAFAAGEKEYCRKLVYSSTKFSFFLMSVVSIPLIVNLHYVLELWLVKVPEFTYEFLVIVLISTLLSLLTKSTTTVLLAEGHIKFFQIVISTLFVLEIPIAYILLYFEYAPYIVVLPAIVTQILGILFRFYLLNKMDKNYVFSYFMIHIVTRSIAVVLLSYIVCSSIAKYSSINFPVFLIESICFVLITIALIYSLGLEKSERNIVNDYLRKITTKVR